MTRGDVAKHNGVFRSSAVTCPQIICHDNIKWATKPAGTREILSITLFPSICILCHFFMVKSMQYVKAFTHLT